MKTTKTLLIIWLTFLGFSLSQSDVFVIQSGDLVEGQSTQFPIYFQDVSGTGVDTGTTNVGSFSINMNIPAGLIEQVSFERAGVIASSPVIIEADTSDLSQNKLSWYVAFSFGNVPFFNLDPPAPGELIGYLTLTASVGTAGSLLTLSANQTETFVQDEFGNVTNTLQNGKLIADFQNINIISSGGGSNPQITSFSVSPTQIQSGEVAELSWSVTDADTVSIDQSVGSVLSSGTLDVSPTATTTYTLSATNQQGTSTAQVSLTVVEPNQPVITSFTLNPTVIDLGSSSSITWATQEAESVSITPAISGAPNPLPLSGNLQVSPDETTTYTLSATNPQGTTTEQATLTVNMPGQPVITNFSANPGTILQGESTSLSWSTSNAISVTLEPLFPGAPSPLPTIGTFEISPTSTTSYTLTARNSAGDSVQSTTVINVTIPQGKPSINSFYANPDNPEKGAQYDVSWDVDPGTATTLLTLETNEDIWTGITFLQDSRTYTADKSTVYTLTAENDFGVVSRSFNLEVQGLFEIVNFESNKSAVFKGQEVTLSWFVTNADQLFIEPQVGNVSNEGQQVVVIDEPVTFKLTANRDMEQKTATATVDLLDLEEGRFLYFPLIRDDEEWFTEIGLVNLAPVIAVFDVYRFDEDGNAIEFFTNKRMAPFESMNFVFDSFKEDRGWVKVWNKNDDIGSVGLFGWSNLKTRDGKQLVASSASRISDGNILVPHLAKDSSFYTHGALVSAKNGGEAYFNSSGSSFLINNLAENQSTSWDFRDLMSGDLGQDGWGRLTGEANLEQTISGLEIFGRTPQTGLAQAVGISLDGATAEELIFTHIAKDVNKFWTGCVVINPNENAVNLEIKVFNDAGEVLAGPTPETLDAGGKRTILVDKNQNGLALGTSWAVFKASEPIFGYMLFGSYASDDFFSGFQSVKVPSKTLCFPDTEMSRELNHSEGGWTGLALVNNNQIDNQIRLVLINESGEEKGSVEMILGPRKKFIGLVSSIFKDQTLEKGDKVMAFASQTIAGFELYGKNTETLGGILAFPWQFE